MLRLCLILCAAFAPSTSQRCRPEAPWDVRAAETRAALQDTLGLGDQLEAVKIELREARAQLRHREKELLDSAGLGEQAAKRIEVAREDAQRVSQRAETQCAEMRLVSSRQPA